MKLKRTIKLIVSAIALALACIIFTSAESSLGQTDQAPSTPRPVPSGSVPDRDNNSDTRERPTSDGAFSSVNTKTESTKNRNAGEEMVVIDAATRQKEKEREKTQHDKTFESSIMDVGVDSIPVGKPKAKPETIPSANSIPSATPSPQPSATPAATPAPSSDLGSETSLTLEVVPIISSTQPSAVPSATASPHN